MQSFARGGFRYITALAALCFAANTQATTYYVSNSGSDSNSGTSPAHPWKTVNKIDTINFAAGDQIRFAGGQTFYGKLYFDPADAGNASNPIVISSYGVGRAAINGGVDSAFFAYNCAGLTITNLNCVGAGANANHADGIAFYADLGGDVKLDTIKIDSVSVSGFGKSGISIGSWNNATGYKNVRITNVAAHDNRTTGIGTYAQANNGNQNIYIGYCSAYNNFGDSASSQNTGSGIVLGSVNGATIERCVAHDNGKNCHAPEGPVGIWCYDSANVTIQYNESYHNHTTSAADGDGFDLDVGVVNSVLQYNYSHDNDGAGFLLCSVGQNDGNVVRYNISQSDGRHNGYGAIHTWGNVSNAQIYNNTIYVTPSVGSSRAVHLSTPTTNLRFWNNIFMTAGGGHLVELASGQSGLQFQGNDYFSAYGSMTIVDNGTSYYSLGSWQAVSAQEMLNGATVGLSVNPALVHAGGGGTLGNANLLSTLSAYSLQQNSPVINHGVNLSSFGVNTGGKDFFGHTSVAGGAPDIGACERR